MAVAEVFIDSYISLIYFFLGQLPLMYRYALHEGDIQSGPKKTVPQF